MYLKEGQKLAILLLDGWQLSPQRALNLFHPSSNPFFHNLWENHRSLILKSSTDLDPIKSFYSGQQILKPNKNKERFFKENFLSSILRVKQVDSIQKNQGRIWFLLPGNYSSFQELNQGIKQLPFKKIGVGSNSWQKVELQNIPKTKDIQFIDLTKKNKIEQFIQPEDIVIYLCDLNEIDQFNQILSRQKYKPLDYLVLTDQENSQHFASLISTSPLNDIRSLFKDKAINVKEIELDSDHLPKQSDEQQIKILTVPENYFKINNFSWSDVIKKRDHLARIISDLIRLNFDHLILLSRSGLISENQSPKSTTRSYYLPFIYFNHQPLQIKKRSITQESLTSNHHLVDVAPTLLNLCTISKPDSMEGNSFLSVLLPEIN